MTRHTVTWHQDAEQDLASLWISATDRDDITQAVQAIDLALSSASGSVGDQIAEGLYGLNAPPLRVLYVIRETDRIIEVVMVRRI
jgi:plasmid stabilization system protein ParE